MTIRVRLTLWYTGMLLVSLLLMGGVLYYELVYEHREGVPPQRREEASKQMADILFLYGAPTLALLLIGGWILMRRTLAPITDLTAAARRIHAGNLRERLTCSGNGDELDQLTVVLNEMLSRLDESFRWIRTFTLHASHELKTPLTIIRGEIETLSRAAGCPGPTQEALGGLLGEIQRLARMVDDLSLLTRAGAGELELERAPVRIDELVREAGEDARILAEPTGLSVDLEVCEEQTVMGDRHRLRQLLLNLIENAVKHNRRGGRVAILLRREEKEAVVEVANTGSAVPADQLPFVFEPFFRGTEARRLDREGCGLGLSIARWITEANGGQIDMRSGPEEVTTVVVRLPLAAAQPELKSARRRP